MLKITTVSRRRDVFVAALEGLDVCHNCVTTIINLARTPHHQLPARHLRSQVAACPTRSTMISTNGKHQSGAETGQLARHRVRPALVSSKTRRHDDRRPSQPEQSLNRSGWRWYGNRWVARG